MAKLSSSFNDAAGSGEGSVEDGDDGAVYGREHDDDSHDDQNDDHDDDKDRVTAANAASALGAGGATIDAVERATSGLLADLWRFST